MQGPRKLLRSDIIDELKNLRPLHEWNDGAASLVLDEVSFKGRRGAVMLYDNPPVHQIGNPGLDAMLEALGELDAIGGCEFLILSWPCAPVHAGGDLKESQRRLESTRERRAELETAGAPDREIQQLYDWADGRLDKGQSLYRAMRTLAEKLRTVGVCGGGMRFGGSAEVNLMADWLVGDSRSGMCFSEAMIGLIPGWAGVGRAVTKAGATNARIMAQRAAPVSAADLDRVGLYDVVVEVAEPLPKMGRTGDKEADKARYADALEAHDQAIWPRLLAAGLELAVAPEGELPARPTQAPILADPAEVDAEVTRRADPETYRGLWGKPLREVKDELARLGRPLAPQSIAELTALLDGADAEGFDEDAFVEAEKQADARLYRDERLGEGIDATLGQRVADFREI